MVEIFNFKNGLVVAGHNWGWLLAALILGMLVGYFVCRREHKEMN